MAQFGGNKNPPWAQGGRGGPPGGGAGALDVPGLVGAFGAAAGQGPPVFQGTPTGLPPGLAGVGHLGVPGAGHGPAVTLAAMAGQPGVYPRALGPGTGFPGGPLLQQQQPPQPQVMIQQQPPPHQQQGQQQQQQQQTSQRVFTGTVTKLHDNFGFVDEDVFFQTSVVKGQTPRVNDRVLVEAAYNANMPFKWNATRIQVLPNQNAGRGPNSGGGGQGPPLPSPVVASSTSVTTTSSLNAHAFTNAPPMSHPPPPRMNQPPQQRNEAAFGGGGGSGGPMRGGGGGGGGNDHRNNESNNSMSRFNKNNSPPREQMKRMPPSNDHRRNRDDRSNTRDRDRDRSGGGGGGIGGGGIQDRDRGSRDKDRGSGSGGSSRLASPPPPPSLGNRKRSRSPRRTRSRSRSRSPPRRRPRTAPRYNVSVPKVALNFPESSVYELKKRYNNMYVPSDFFMADHSWMTSFPVHDGFKIQYASTFHIFNKELVESPLLSDAVYDPTDADHSFNAKVMLMAVPPPNVLIEKTCQLAESSATNRDNLVHPTRAIQFLVGTRGKNETLAIGGPWSPSLDGLHPESDPSVLVRTAIRVCRALTGIDLSTCTQWHRFLEIHYRRQETSTKPARTETTVIFLPDIWSVMPTPEEHFDSRTLYEKSLDAKINPPPPPTEVEEEILATPETEIESKKVEENEQSEVKDVDEAAGEEASDNTEENGDEENAEEKQEPTPGSDLDVKSMKVNELRSELEARGLNTKGLKSQLAARLQEALDKELNGAEADKQPETGNDEPEMMDNDPENSNQDDPEVKKSSDNNTKPQTAATSKTGNDEPEVMEIEGQQQKSTTIVPSIQKVKEKPPPPKELDEKQKNALKKAYDFPKEPCILVHPHPKAKSGKFDTTVMSLSVLLDYRTEDNKESTFEVSLFAELFNEMLMRDSGFKLYKSLINASEKPVEEKKSENGGENNSSSDENAKISSITTEENSNAASESSNNENNSSDTTSNKSSTKKKIVTKDKDLLLACSYFDLGHCGYFETKDLEDILTTMNLNLSRAQIKKLLTKVTSGKDQQVNYRQFTDKSEDEELVCYIETDDDHLGQGFRAYLSKPKSSKSASSSSTNSSSSEGICNYRGSVIDVTKLLDQLKRSEKARSDTESQLKSAQKTVSDLQNASDRHVSVKEKLQTEVKDLKKQLKRVEDDMKRSQTDSSKYYTILKDIYSKVHPAVNAPTSPTPSKTESGIKKEDLEESINGKVEVEEAK